MLLRVVQTQAILFLKSMSERGGPDVERLWNWIYRSTQNRLSQVIKIQNRSMSDPPLSDIYFKNKMAWVWTTLNDLQEPLDWTVREFHFWAWTYFPVMVSSSIYDEMDESDFLTFLSLFTRLMNFWLNENFCVGW